MDSPTLEYILHLKRNLKYNKVFIVLFDDFCDKTFPEIITRNKELLDEIMMEHHDERRRTVMSILEKGKNHQMHCSNDISLMNHVLQIVQKFIYKEYGVYFRISVLHPCSPDRTIMIENYR